MDEETKIFGDVSAWDSGNVGGVQFAINKPGSHERAGCARRSAGAKRGRREAGVH